MILIKYATMLLFANFDKLWTHLLVCVLTKAQLSECLGQCKHLTKIYCNSFVGVNLTPCGGAK